VPHFGQILKLRASSLLKRIWRHCSHLTQRPSGTLLGRPSRTSLGARSFLNHIGRGMVAAIGDVTASPSQDILAAANMFGQSDL
jgi:hypothetical protein